MHYSNRCLVSWVAGAIMLVLMSSCSQPTLSPQPVNTYSPSIQPAVESPTPPMPTATMVENQAIPSPSPTRSKGQQPEVQSAFDPAKPEASQVAIAALADRLHVKPELISVISTGGSSDAPVDCELDLPDKRVESLLGSMHQKVILVYKEKQYVYWVFVNSPELLIPLRCK